MRKLTIAFLLAFLPLAPARAQFCPGVAPWVFADVSASHAFCTYVTWMAQSNVTLGCRVIDANNREYCPDDYVTRLQMAAFMNRLGSALFPLTCAPGQVMKWNGAAWTCSDDVVGGSGGGGTVTSVLAGTGLQGMPNPITGAGSLNLAPTFQLPQGCASNQIPKWNGSAWSCAADADTNSGGTVTSVTAGTGLAGGTIASSGTISVAPGYQMPQGCAANQVPKWIGGAWACAADADANSGGTVTSVTAGTGLTGGTIAGSGTIAADTNYLQRRVSASCVAGSSIRAIAADGSVTCETDDAGPANAFVLGGNTFGQVATLGTTDNFALRIEVNGERVMRYEPNAISPNVIGGSPANSVTAGVRGATIAGGGVPAGDTDPNFFPESPNRVTDAYGTVGGGFGNRAGDDAGTTVDNAFATVGGGRGNTATRGSSTVGGGNDNAASGFASTVGGGVSNTASGNHSRVGGGTGNTASGHESTLGGGSSNTATGWLSAVGGGNGNDATGRSSTVGGGQSNTASGQFSTVAGGSNNIAGGDYSVAMGRRAKITHDGAFVFADSQSFDFPSGSNDSFRVRATGGGVRFVVEIDGAGGTVQSCLYNSATGGWSCMSDRNAKQDLVELDGRQVLERLVAMPIYAWSPIGQSAHVRHYGPMAQDFHAAFRLGDSDTMIGTQDADGVALAAIKGLNEKVETQAQEFAALKRLVEQLLAVR